MSTDGYRPMAALRGRGKKIVHPPIFSAHLLPPDPRDSFPKSTKVNNFRKGNAYENKVNRFLRSEFPEEFKTGINIAWTDKVHKHKTCKPDGLIWFDDSLIVLEMKTNSLRRWESIPPL